MILDEANSDQCSEVAEPMFYLADSPADQFQ